MDAPGRVAPLAAEPPTGGRPRGAAAIATVRAPFTRRAMAELLYCVVAAALGIGVPLAALGFVAAIGLLAPGPGKPDNASIGGLAAGLLLLLVLATRLGRALGAVRRSLAAGLLGERVAPPAPFQPGRGIPGRLNAVLSDGAGWRAVAYLLVTLPVAVVQAYAVAFWVTGLVDVTFPLWWGLFRNSPPGVQLHPVPVFTPFGSLFEVGTHPGTLGAVAVGAALLLAAPWVARAGTAADRGLIRALLGPGRLEQRVHELTQTRALAVDDSAALLRRLERNLHDGAQIRLAALALHLGMAKEELAAGGELDIAKVRELVDAAHEGAKDALVELRNLARGIHPPVLDNGLADALAALTTGSAIPVELTTDIPDRPTPAIETIAYFCAAELLANAAKHSDAASIRVQATERGGMLLLTVTDDGIGGVDPTRGSGLAGLLHRVSTVDGRLEVASPPGGPTRITVALPLRA